MEAELSIETTIEFQRNARRCVLEGRSTLKLKNIFGMWRCVDPLLTDVSEERRLTQDVHSATSQQTTFFIVTAVETSNRTYSEIVIKF
jgi:hypothetical protein